MSMIVIQQISWLASYYRPTQKFSRGSVIASNPAVPAFFTCRKKSWDGWFEACSFSCRRLLCSSINALFCTVLSCLEEDYNTLVEMSAIEITFAELWIRTFAMYVYGYLYLCFLVYFVNC